MRAINTLFSLGKGGGWCGCGYLDARVDVPESSARIDFNGPFPLPEENVPYSMDWFMDERDIAGIVYDPEYEGLEIGGGHALLAKSFHNTGLCRMVVNRALSYHPAYRGSSLETIAALQCAFCQSAYGTWGEVHLSSMFGFMERFRHPLCGFLMLRSVPLLIRTQRADGFWEEGPLSDEPDPGFPPPMKQESTFMILRALKTFGFLEALCSGS